MPPKLRDMKPHERLARVAPELGSDAAAYLSAGGMSATDADVLVENAVGAYGVPLGVAEHFVINGRPYAGVPMATEEPSVIAAAGAGAKAAIDLNASSSEPRVAGQVLVMNPDSNALESLKDRRREIIDAANKSLPSARMRVDEDWPENGLSYAMLAEDMLRVAFYVNTVDAMGANSVNTACEGVAPLIEDATGGTALLRILSNHMQRVAYAESVFDVPQDVAANVVNACRFARLDVSRAVTHNKGIMNGITAVALATGQDTRAIEAGAHAYASTEPGKGTYGPLSAWEVRDGRLHGSLSVPLAVGTVGGLTTRHPVAAACLHDILGSPTAGELAQIMAAVGLCQNFSALRALVTDGIQRGHMALHARRFPIPPPVRP